MTRRARTCRIAVALVLATGLMSMFVALKTGWSFPKLHFRTPFRA